MLITVRSLTCVYPLHTCEAGVELTETVNGIVRIAEQLKVSIPKPYDSITPAVEWEVAKVLHAAGFDVTIPPEPDDGVLPEQTQPFEFPEPEPAPE